MPVGTVPPDDIGGNSGGDERYQAYAEKKRAEWVDASSAFEEAEAGRLVWNVATDD